MGETSAQEPAVLFVAGTEQVRVTGRTALILAQIAVQADKVNQIPVGRLSVDFAQAKVKTEFTESLPAVRLELTPVDAPHPVEGRTNRTTPPASS